MSDTENADPDRPWRDPQRLKELYFKEHMTMYEIADELGCSYDAIQYQMDKHGIERRQKTINRPWADADRMRRLYHDKRMSFNDIADELGCSEFTVNEWIKRHGIETRSRREAAKLSQVKQPPSHRFTRDGYEIVEAGDGNGDTDVIRIHRLVMVAKHGVGAVKDKVVHHKNEVPWDNRPDNLVLMTASEHTAHHRPIDRRWGDR